MKLAAIFLRQFSMGLAIGAALAGSGFYFLMFTFVYFILWSAT